MDKKAVIEQAEKLCLKFIQKVETGRARSKETYEECKKLLENIYKLKKEDSGEK